MADSNECEICYEKNGEIVCKRDKCPHLLCRGCYNRVDACPFCQLTIVKSPLDLPDIIPRSVRMFIALADEDLGASHITSRVSVWRRSCVNERMPDRSSFRPPIALTNMDREERQFASTMSGFY